MAGPKTLRPAAFAAMTTASMTSVNARPPTPAGSVAAGTGAGFIESLAAAITSQH